MTRHPERGEAERHSVPSTDETKLIGEAQHGDTAAFEELVRHYDGRVLRLALRMVRSEEEARDVYQEVFLRVFRSLGRFRHECRFETWLFRIVTNVCLDHLRRITARGELPSVRGPGGDSEAQAGARVVDERPEHDPERLLARDELRRRIMAALAGLPPRERLVFELRHYEGLRLRQIGDLLETSEDTVKNCLFRAHRKMRLVLQDLGEGGGRALTARAGPAQAET
jgi:RNA polymerase sigma-70 factor (ECF subfamily)